MVVRLLWQPATVHCTWRINFSLTHVSSRLCVYDLNTTQINTTQQQTKQCRSLMVSGKSFCNEMTCTLLGLHTELIVLVEYKMRQHYPMTISVLECSQIQQARVLISEKTAHWSRR